MIISSEFGRHLPNKGAKCFEVKVIESRIARIFADCLSDGYEMSQNTVRDRDDAVLDDNQNPHDTSHEKLVFLNLFGLRVFLHKLEEVF